MTIVNYLAERIIQHKEEQVDGAMAVAIEGLSNSGKSTLAAKLRSKMNTDGFTT